MNKELELQKVTRDIERCKICKQEKSGKAVPGEGNPDADIVFLGEAPGKEEAKTGRPFIGRSGQLLRSLIRSIGLREEDIYITSPVKYLPDSGTPSAKDIDHGRIHLEKQLNIIHPKFVVLLGRVAAQAMIGEHISIMKEHGRIIKKDNRKYFLTLHPAAILRFAKYKPIFLSDFQNLKSILGLHDSIFF